MIAQYFIFVIITMFVLIAEACYLYLCFLKKYLFQKKKTLSKFVKQVKELYKYMSNVKRNKILLGVDMNKFMEERKGNFQSFFVKSIIWGIVLFIYAITCSGLLSVFLLYAPKRTLLFGIILVIAVEISVFREFITKYINIYVELLDEFTLYLFQFGKLLSKESVKEINTHPANSSTVDWRGIFFLIAAVIVMLYLLKKHNIGLHWTHLLNLYYKSNLPMTVALGGMATAFMAMSYFRQKASSRKEEITYDTRLMLWEDDIEKICNKLHIKSVEIKIVDDIADEVVTSIIKKNEVPQIRIGGFFLNNLNKDFSKEIFRCMILFILGHELSHISTKDSLNRSSFRLFTFIFSGYIMYLLIFKKINLYLYNATGSIEPTTTASLVMLGIALCLYFVIEKTWSDERFWRQVNELRADRIGLQVAGVSVETFRNLMQYYQTELMADDDFHPPYSTRNTEIEKYKDYKWGLKDYLRYTWRFTWNLTFHQNWRL